MSLTILKKSSPLAKTNLYEILSIISIYIIIMIKIAFLKLTLVMHSLQQIPSDIVQIPIENQEN